MQSLKTKFAIVFSTLLISCVALETTVKAEPIQVCQYNPDLGKPNPLGMRSYITITEADGNTAFLYEQFPSPVSVGTTPVTISSSRELIFYDTSIHDARQLMLQSRHLTPLTVVGHPSDGR